MKGNKTLKGIFIAIIAYVLVCVTAVTFLLVNRPTKHENTEVAESVNYESLNLAEREKLRAMNYSSVTDSNYGTGASNVKFAAFFLRDLDGDGYAEKYAGTCKNVGEKDTLYMELKVLTSGYLENGQISISNSNFKWKTAIVSDTIGAMFWMSGCRTSFSLSVIEVSISVIGVSMMSLVVSSFL